MLSGVFFHVRDVSATCQQPVRLFFVLSGVRFVNRKHVHEVPATCLGCVACCLASWSVHELAATCPGCDLSLSGVRPFVSAKCLQRVLVWPLVVRNAFCVSATCQRSVRNLSGLHLLSLSSVRFCVLSATCPRSVRNLSEFCVLWSRVRIYCVRGVSATCPGCVSCCLVRVVLVRDVSASVRNLSWLRLLLTGVCTFVSATFPQKGCDISANCPQLVRVALFIVRCAFFCVHDVSGLRYVLFFVRFSLNSRRDRNSSGFRCLLSGVRVF